MPSSLDKVTCLRAKPEDAKVSMKEPSLMVQAERLREVREERAVDMDLMEPALIVWESFVRDTVWRDCELRAQVCNKLLRSCC